MEKGKVKKEKTTKELKQELMKLRNEELKQAHEALGDFCRKWSIDLGSRTITEEGGSSRNEIFIIDKL